MDLTQYFFTNNWFEVLAKNVWDVLIPQMNPTRILEIGSYEGASTVYLIDKLAINKDIELHCVDTWEGGIEHKESGVDMSIVEKLFHNNTKLSISKATNHVKLFTYKGFSDAVMSKMFVEGKKGYFDFIYVDGSHQAPDVLLDAILSFKLLKINGFIAFDDYLWNEPLEQGIDPIRSPKMAIDAFTSIYCRKIKILNAPLYQLYIQKIDE